MVKLDPEKLQTVQIQGAQALPEFENKQYSQ
jgi:hypothetical protein